MAKIRANEFEYIQRKKKGEKKKNYEMNFYNLFFVLQFLEFSFPIIPNYLMAFRYIFISMLYPFYSLLW